MLAPAAQGNIVLAPTFNPNATVTYGPDSLNSFTTSGTPAISGAALPPGSNGTTGATYTGSASFTGNGNGSGTNVVGNIQEFSISGNGNGGSLNTTSDAASIHYNFTLAETDNPSNGDFLAITSWQLNLSVTTNAGVNSTIVTGGSGVNQENQSIQYQGTAVFPLSGADSGTETLSSYSAALTVNYTRSHGSTGGGATLSVTIPAGSIDFNTTAVPEPSNWLILAVGVAGAGVQLARVRQRRATPTV